MKKRYIAALLSILIFSFILNIIGIDWGVPSVERNKLYFDNTKQAEESLKGITEEKLIKSQTAGKEEMSGSKFNPVRSYHPDESQFIESFSNMNPKKFDFNPHYFYYGTFYFFFLSISFALGYIFKFLVLTRDLSFFYSHPYELAKFYIAGRMVSAVFGVLIVVMTYIIAKKLYGERKALIAALATSIMPILLIQTHVIAVDVTGVFFILTTFYFTLQLLNSEEKKYYIYAGIAAGLSGGTKYTMFLVIFIIPFAHFLKEKKTLANFIRAFLNKKVFLSYLFAVIAFLAVNPFVIISYKEVMTQTRIAVASSQANLFQGIIFYLKGLYFGMTPPLFFFCLAGSVMVFIRKRREEMLILSWMIFDFLIFSMFSQKYPHYILAIMPFMVMFGTKTLDLFKNKYLKNIFLVFLLIFAFLFTLGYEKLFIGENIRTTAGKWISENIPAGEKIGLRRDPYQFETPPINRSKYKLVITGMDPEEIKKQAPRYFVISDFEYNKNPDIWQAVFEKLHYARIKEFSNPPRIFGAPFNYKKPVDNYLYIYPQIFIYCKR